MVCFRPEVFQQLPTFPSHPTTSLTPSPSSACRTPSASMDDSTPPTSALVPLTVLIPLLVCLAVPILWLTIQMLLIWYIGLRGLWTRGIQQRRPSTMLAMMTNFGFSPVNVPEPSWIGGVSAGIKRGMSFKVYSRWDTTPGEVHRQYIEGVDQRVSLQNISSFLG